ncbi:recombinase family protein [Escherichia sp. TWPC-MK]
MKGSLINCKLIRLARTGDTIVFDSLTRLGRSMNDVLEEFRYYEQQRINLQFNKRFFNKL